MMLQVPVDAGYSSSAGRKDLRHYDLDIPLQDLYSDVIEEKPAAVM